MTRPIKFRAWKKSESRMFSWEELIYMDYPESLNFGDVMHRTYLADIMQFTGFKDKNGVEIYEGDILNHKQDKASEGGGWIAGTCDYHPECARVVTFEDGQFLLDGNSIQKELWWLNRCHKPGVIGNIHKNPELLL